ncbi:hypothetical protein SAMN05216355_101312 [Actinomyces ruminicola]|uniref:Exonuclease SbcD n=1 Tax=Actinomyces ruminicola TaxID=332524 RepID=A0A1G9ZNU4_9ACTO|nr:hypothetical protein SAMN05216355_101312 [Actinomyces ruminicola]
MRILHTSDWHLGRTFHGRVLDDAQTRPFSPPRRDAITDGKL